MPRKNPIADREARICARLKEFRKSTGRSRVAFARECHIDSSELARIEHGLAPVRFRLAKKISDHFRLSLIWLVSGEGDRFDYDSVDSSKGNEEDPLTTVYDGKLKPDLKFRSRTRLAAKVARLRIDFPVAVGASKEEEYWWALSDALKSDLAKIPAESQKDYCRALIKFSAEYLKSKRRDKHEET